MHRILVIDDNADDLALAEVALSRAGFEVLLLDEPLRAVEIAAAYEVAGILLDRRMPESSGLDVLRALRSDPRTRPIPILFVSADGDVESRIEGLQEGANDYLPKPFHPAELVLRVERLVATASTATDSLEGKIEDISLGDVLQTLANGRKSGFFVIVAGEIGRLVIAEGEILSASRGRLTGREALVDLVAIPKGRFRFISRSTSHERAAAVAPIDLQGALLEAAWMDDEFRRVKENLPAADDLLWLHRQTVVSERCRPLPIDEVVASLRKRSGSTLVELTAEITAAPKKISLAVAYLIANGNVAIAGSAGRAKIKAEVAEP